MKKLIVLFLLKAFISVTDKDIKQSCYINLNKKSSIPIGCISHFANIKAVENKEEVPSDFICLPGSNIYVLNFLKTNANVDFHKGMLNSYGIVVDKKYCYYFVFNNVFIDLAIDSFTKIKVVDSYEKVPGNFALIPGCINLYSLCEGQLFFHDTDKSKVKIIMKHKEKTFDLLKFKSGSELCFNCIYFMPFLNSTYRNDNDLFDMIFYSVFAGVGLINFVKFLKSVDDFYVFESKTQKHTFLLSYLAPQFSLLLFVDLSNMTYDPSLCFSILSSAQITALLAYNNRESFFNLMKTLKAFYQPLKVKLSFYQS